MVHGFESKILQISQESDSYANWNALILTYESDPFVNLIISGLGLNNWRTVLKIKIALANFQSYLDSFDFGTWLGIIRQKKSTICRTKGKTWQLRLVFCLFLTFGLTFTIKLRNLQNEIKTFRNRVIKQHCASLFITIIIHIIIG